MADSVYPMAFGAGFLGKGWVPAAVPTCELVRYEGSSDFHVCKHVPLETLWRTSRIALGPDLVRHAGSVVNSLEGFQQVCMFVEEFLLTNCDNDCGCGPFSMSMA